MYVTVQSAMRLGQYLNRLSLGVTYTDVFNDVETHHIDENFCIRPQHRESCCITVGRAGAAVRPFSVCHAGAGVMPGLQAADAGDCRVKAVTNSNT